MKIIWNKVTKFSQLIAIVLFVGVFFFGFFLGRRFEDKFILGDKVASNIKFTCADNKTIYTDFYKNFVHIETSSLGTLYLPQTISASGARYANTDESVVFWNKGNTAFITEGNPNNTTYKDCVTNN